MFPLFGVRLKGLGTSPEQTVKQKAIDRKKIDQIFDPLAFAN